MSEERRNYRHGRVLIESDRILSPQFADAVVFLSGAQVEMLRNMTQYLRRLQTYVSAYHETHYLTPDASDYDAILAIVSDLEETLMGNPNTIWGYKDKYVEYLSKPSDPGGTKLQNGSDVPEGELWVVNYVHAWDDTTVCDSIAIQIEDNSSWHTVVILDNPVVDEGVWWTGELRLAEGDNIRAEYVGTANGEDLYLDIRGYIMDVP